MALIISQAIVRRPLRRQISSCQSIFTRHFCGKSSASSPSIRSHVSLLRSFRFDHPTKTFAISTNRTSPSPPSQNPVSEGPTAISITVEQYHQLTDIFFEKLVNVLETEQEEREDVDVEYSSGVLTLVFPPHGTYVINKQPPSRQIWFSSPVSGPKRFDYVQASKGKDWVYLRDGTVLRDLVEEELGVDIEAAVDGWGQE